MIVSGFGFAQGGLCWEELLFLDKTSELPSRIWLWMIAKRYSSAESKSKGKVNPGMLTFVPHT